MEKELSSIRNQIFNELKDSKDNLPYMLKKYQGVDIDFQLLHKNIINYQKKTYGCTLKELEKIKEEERKHKHEYKSRNENSKRRAS